MSENTSDQSHLRTMKIRWFSMIFIFFLTYATLRYIVFKGVAPIHFPIYIVNKVFSISGVFFLALSYSITKIRWITFRNDEVRNEFIKFIGLIGFSLCAMHVFLSMIILSPGYFPKFYDGDMMSFTGELSMLMGVVSLYFFSIPAIATIPFMRKAVGIKKWQKRQKIGYLGLLTAMLHSAAMGISGWIHIDDWPGYLPPITLLAFLIAVVPLVLKLYKKS